MLGQLGYCAPRILRELVAVVAPDIGKNSLAILDLGCGTGLTGMAFKDLAQRLDGIDLSPAMIEKARERGIYDNLTADDIVNLTTRTDFYDVVLAADTLVYLGDLSRVLEVSYAALKPDGLFLFSAEKRDGAGYDLGPKRRWRHSEEYLRDEAVCAGFSVSQARFAGRPHDPKRQSAFVARLLRVGTVSSVTSVPADV